MGRYARLTCDQSSAIEHQIGPASQEQRDLSDNENNRLGARASRYVRVGTSVGSVAMRAAGKRLLGMEGDDSRYAAELAQALGGLKGPIMKVAQLLSTIPEAVPEEYAQELAQLQSQAPAMGPAFVKRRMMAELGRDWRDKFASFEIKAAASASLGQVHRATALDGAKLAVKLQYPDMSSAVEADVNQLKVIFALHARTNPAVDTKNILQEIAERLREELDYKLEAAHLALYHDILSGTPLINVPRVLPKLSSKRLLTMTWLEGNPLLDYKGHAIEQRNVIAKAMFQAWWGPFSSHGVIHGDPHLGNYNVFHEDSGLGKDSAPAGINLLDYGCIRTFAPKFVQGVLDLYRGLEHGDNDLIMNAYESWGFTGLSKEVREILNVWARFIYGPLLDDRVRTIAEGTTPGEYGRKEAFKVHKALKELGPVAVPREFVFMDRAAIGLGGAFLHLDAKLNFYQLFNQAIEGFDLGAVAVRQRAAFTRAGVPLPEGVANEQP